MNVKKRKILCHICKDLNKPLDKANSAPIPISRTILREISYSNHCDAPIRNDFNRLATISHLPLFQTVLTNVTIWHDEF